MTSDYLSYWLLGEEIRKSVVRKNEEATPMMADLVKELCVKGPLVIAYKVARHMIHSVVFISWNIHHLQIFQIPHCSLPGTGPIQALNIEHRCLVAI